MDLRDLRAFSPPQSIRDHLLFMITWMLLGKMCNAASLCNEPFGQLLNDRLEAYPTALA